MFKNLFSSNKDEDVNFIVKQGFSKDAAIDALQHFDGNKDKAL